VQFISSTRPVVPTLTYANDRTNPLTGHTASASMTQNSVVSLFIYLLKPIVLKWAVWRGWICSPIHWSSILTHRSQRDLAMGFDSTEQG